MMARILFSLLLFSALSNWIACAQSPQVLRIHVDYDPAHKSHFILLSNYGLRVVCFSEYVFDTDRTYIYLTDAHGQRVRVAYHDEVPDRAHSIDLMPAYYLLKPGASRKFYIEDRNFLGTNGSYRYNTRIPYFYCGDLQRLDDDKAGNVPLFYAVSGGPFQLKN